MDIPKSIPTLNFAHPWRFLELMENLEGVEVLIRFTGPREIEEGVWSTNTQAVVLRVDRDFLVVNHPDVGTWAIFWEHVLELTI